MSGFDRAADSLSLEQLSLLKQINDKARDIEADGVVGMAAYRIALIIELSNSLASAAYVREKVDSLFGRE